MSRARRAWVGIALAACVLVARNASADEPPAQSAAVETTEAAPTAEATPAVEPTPTAEPTKPASAATTEQPQPKSAPAPKVAVKTNREAIALLYGFAFGVVLIALRLVARFRRDMFGRAAAR